MMAWRLMLDMPVATSMSWESTLSRLPDALFQVADRA